MQNTMTVIGEFDDNPDRYRKDGCFFCCHFISYADLYEDALEPGDAGQCTRTKEHVSYSDSCEHRLPKGRDFEKERDMPVKQIKDAKGRIAIVDADYKVQEKITEERCLEIGGHCWETRHEHSLKLNYPYTAKDTTYRKCKHCAKCQKGKRQPEIVWEDEKETNYDR